MILRNLMWAIVASFRQQLYSEYHYRNGSVISCASSSLGPIAELIASMIACCSGLSSMVGDSLQYFVPYSTRLTHRQTTLTLFFLCHVQR